MLRADIDDGAPTNADGTITLVQYAAWLVQQMNVLGGRRGDCSSLIAAVGRGDQRTQRASSFSENEHAIYNEMTSRPDAIVQAA